MKFREYKQGVYKPINKEKCLNPDSIEYRSNLELKMMMIFDKNPNVLKWGSEYFIINYYNSVKRRNARYYVDFYVELSDGNIRLYEVKPFKEYDAIINPKPDNKKSKKKLSTKIYESAMKQMNKDKWDATQKFCQQSTKKITFHIITEREIEELYNTKTKVP